MWEDEHRWPAAHKLRSELPAPAEAAVYRCFSRGSAFSPQAVLPNVRLWLASRYTCQGVIQICPGCRGLEFM